MLHIVLCTISSIINCIIISANDIVINIIDINVDTNVNNNVRTNIITKIINLAMKKMLALFGFMAHQLLAAGGGCSVAAGTSSTGTVRTGTVCTSNGTVCTSTSISTYSTVTVSNSTGVDTINNVISSKNTVFSVNSVKLCVIAAILIKITHFSQNVRVYLKNSGNECFAPILVEL